MGGFLIALLWLRVHAPSLRNAQVLSKLTLEAGQLRHLSSFLSCQWPIKKVSGSQAEQKNKCSKTLHFFFVRSFYQQARNPSIHLHSCPETVYKPQSCCEKKSSHQRKASKTASCVSISNRSSLSSATRLVTCIIQPWRTKEPTLKYPRGTRKEKTNTLEPDFPPFVQRSGQANIPLTMPAPQQASTTQPAV